MFNDHNFSYKSSNFSKDMKRIRTWNYVIATIANQENGHCMSYWWQCFSFLLFNAAISFIFSCLLKTLFCEWRSLLLQIPIFIKTKNVVTYVLAILFFDFQFAIKPKFSLPFIFYFQLIYIYIYMSFCTFFPLFTNLCDFYVAQSHFSCFRFYC